MLTPSSNTALEPLTVRMLGDLHHISVHFGRFNMAGPSSSGAALTSCDTEEIVAAASLLSHAKCDVIAWSGTSSGWIGFSAEEALRAEIERVTTARACTSVLALNEVLRATHVRTLGLVTPYLDDVQAHIIADYQSIGIDVVSEFHFRLQDGFSIAEVEKNALADAVRGVAQARPDAIVTACANLPAAPLIEELETELGIPCYDTIQTAVWKSLVLCEEAPTQIIGWGSLFRNVTPLLAVA
ncbi:Asp/Glu/hydantoin racemase [Telmatospirillum siberiense]|uniref:Asp/Glu/hydantoin racemase n=2 Tax=Telmatospirillum siberiense TaxID=382514 RepID=A0A2N3PUX4_9PROT|nr:Asp/Glu/hydantoin racemase [Telmatospirillum siberiense]